MNCIWYDIDFEEVIQERRKYFKETDSYHLIATDIRQNDWLKKIPKNKDAIIIMEGISMYLINEELKQLFQSFTQHFNQIHLLIDCYTTFAAKLSKYKNPIQDVGVTTVYGIDDPKRMTCPKMYYLCEHELTPKKYIDKLEAIEKIIFKHLFSGKLAKSMYRLYEYQKDNE